MEIENKKIDEGSSVRNQYLAGLIMNIVCFSLGCSIGWTSPILPILSEPNDIIGAPLTIGEASTIASIMCAGGLLASPLFGWASDKFGRRKSCLIANGPLLLSWVLPLVWRSPIGIMVARFITGVGGAGAYLITPTYCMEIASTTTRGALGSFMILFFNTGILFMYIMGAFLSYDTILYVNIVFPVAFMFLMYKMPETPVYLLRNNKEKEAAEAIGWLRGELFDSPVVNNVILSLKHDIALANKFGVGGSMHDLANAKGSNEKISSKEIIEEAEETAPWKLLVYSVPTRNAFVVCFLLLSTQVFTGNFAILTFANDIFKQAGSNWSPDANSILVGVIQLVGSLLATTLIEKIGRKVLLIGSCFSQAISMLALGIYFHMQNQQMDVSSIGWIPVTAVSFAVFTYSIGIGPIPYILPTEMLMVQARGIAIGIIFLWAWLTSYILAQFFMFFVELFGTHSIFYGFGIVGVFGLFISIFCLPETKEKPLETIIAYYSRKTKIDMAPKDPKELKGLI